MGIDVQLEDEDGAPIEQYFDPRNLLSHFVLERKLSSTQCLRFIDPYGNTVFNQFQIPVLLEEITAARVGVGAATREYFDVILRLANLAMTEPHQYIRFIGD